MLGNAPIIKNDSTHQQAEGTYQCDTSSKYTGIMIVITPTKCQIFTPKKLDIWGNFGW
ncbi:hypothetical protein QUB00_14215 [Microcoleus sp. F8_C2]